MPSALSALGELTLLSKWQNHFKKLPEQVSSQTIQRVLKKTGLKAVVKANRPALSKCHHRERLDFTKSHQHWTVEDWKRVIWSDGRKWVWKKSGEGLSDRLVEGTVKFGGGHVMLWGCFGWDGVGYACKVDGNMDANLYVSILEDELQKSLQYWGKNPEEVVFQQDNDPKHTSKRLKPGWKTMDLMSWCGLLNPLTSIPLSIYGVTSRGSLESMSSHLQAFRSYGPGFRRNGMILGSRSVGI